MKKGIRSITTSLNAIKAHSIIYSDITYVLFGLKTSCDIYIPAGDVHPYYCITQFGENITIDLRDGKWIDTTSGQQTDVSKAIGIAIDRNTSYHR